MTISSLGAWGVRFKLSSEEESPNILATAKSEKLIFPFFDQPLCALLQGVKD